jgi:hypothetical protein
VFENGRLSQELKPKQREPAVNYKIHGGFSFYLKEFEPLVMYI